MGQFFLQFRSRGVTQRRPGKTQGQTAAEESERSQCGDETGAETDGSPQHGDITQENQEAASQGDV